MEGLILIRMAFNTNLKEAVLRVARTMSLRIKKRRNVAAHLKRLKIFRDKGL